MNQREAAVDFSKAKLPTLWYENENGDRVACEDGSGPPPGFLYLHSEFARELTHTCHRAVTHEEVEACPHPPDAVQPTGGWIDGVEGRECKRCGGTQVKPASEPWPEVWEAKGSRLVFSGVTTWPTDLVMALVRPTLRERLRALSRGHWTETCSVERAIKIAAHSCERCMNALAYAAGLTWGYPEGSKEWRDANTRCKFCEASCR